MKNDLNGTGPQKADLASTEENHPKQTWQKPVVEEVDYSETQSSFIHPGGIDLGFYS